MTFTFTFNQRDRTDGTYSTHGREEMHTVLFGTLEENRLLSRHGREEMHTVLFGTLEENRLLSRYGRCEYSREFKKNEE
jgi:hypothetical protein